jgi:hypothetical protein
MDALDPALFIGSSSEGVAIARELQAEVDGQCEPTVWSQDVFQSGGTFLGELLKTAENTDFAALILTPDDSLRSRGVERPTARDNVILELGLFLGALGSQRVFIIRPRDQDLRLPSDLAGVTVLDYKTNRRDGNLRAAIGPAATAIRNRISIEGLRGDRGLAAQPVTAISASRRGLTIDEEQRELSRELDAIAKSATAQGWMVKTRSDTAFRLVARNGNRYSFPIGSAAETRDRLRSFSEQLSGAGLRLPQTVLNPLNQGPG